MNESLNFVLDKILSGQCNGMNSDDFKKAYEYNFNTFMSQYNEKIQELYKSNEMKLRLEIKNEHGNLSKSVMIEYDPNAEFEYFTMERCVCDGTLSLMVELMNSLFNKLLRTFTFNINTAPDDYVNNSWNYDVKYTVGNFVLNEEFGEFGTKEKPWMHSRFTAMLPIKFEATKNHLRK